MSRTSCAGIWHKRHFLGRPFLFSGAGVPSFFTQTHWFAKLPTGTEAAGQRFFFPPGPPASAEALPPCRFWMPLHTLGPTSWQKFAAGS